MAGGKLSDLRRQQGEGDPAQTPFAFEPAPRGGMAPEPPRRTRTVQSATLYRHRRWLAAPAPDPTTPYLTGRYECEDEQLGTFTLMVNQAGTRLELWMVEVLMASRRDEQYAHIYADRKEDGTFEVRAYTNPREVLGIIASASVDGGRGLEFRLGATGQSGTLRFKLVAEMPVVSDAVLERIPQDRPEFRLLERAPLFSTHLTWLRRQLSPENIEPFLRRYGQVAGQPGVAGDQYRLERARALEEYLANVFSTQGAEGWHANDMPLVRFYAKLFLSAQRVTLNSVSRSHLDWMQLMAIQVTSIPWLGSRASELPAMRANLGLVAASPSASEQSAEHRHRYDIQFGVGGLGGEVILIGLGGFIGGCTVRKIASNGDEVWRRQYLMWFGQIGAGFGANIQMGQMNDGTGYSAVDWTPDDFPGAFSIIGNGAHAGLGIGGGGGAQMMMIYGRGNLPPLAVDLSSWWSWSSEIGGGVDVLTLASGRLHANGQVNERVLEPGVLTDSTDHYCEGERASEVHFRLGDALLTDDARQLLRIALANELRAATDAGSTLTIIAHADRVDTEERNIELTRLRAFNVYQAIKDILGDHLEISEEKTYLFWHGEERARQAGDTDGYPNQRWRRVEVLLNHGILITLRSE